MAKLTPQADRMIKELAKTLPDLQKNSKNGNPLFREVTEFKGTKDYKTNGKGGASWKNELVKKKEPILVNHYLELVSSWEKKGQEGIDAYVGHVRFIESIHKAKEANAQPQSEPVIEPKEKVA